MPIFPSFLLFQNLITAQTSGPTTPEVQSFTPASSNNMVNLFTGDFEYNIPLMDIGGYPINISYNSNVGLEEEASCVGLGWNLNIGVISRQVRGLPDDFMGDQIVKEIHLKPNITLGYSGGVNFEGFGLDPERLVRLGIGLNVNYSYNNYTGFGLSFGTQSSLGLGRLTLGLGQNIGSTTGITTTPSASLALSQESLNETSSIGLGFSASINSLQGMQDIRFNSSINAQKKNRLPSSYGFSANGPSFSLINFADQTYTPKVSLPFETWSGSYKAKLGGEIFGATLSGSITVHGSLQYLKTEEILTPGFGYLYAEKAKGENVLHDFSRENDGEATPDRPVIALPVQTYDTYSASGQGFSGAFRPFRTDIGTVFDPKVSSENYGVVFSAEAAGGNLVKAGADLDVPFGKIESGKWKADALGTPNKSEFHFQFKDNGDIPSFYFKNIGEKTGVIGQVSLDRIGGFNPIRVKLENAASGISPEIDAFLPDGSSPPMAENKLEVFSTIGKEEANIEEINREEASETNTAFSFLTAREKDQKGPGIIYYQLNQFAGADTMPAENEHRKGHHIAEITVTNEDGLRYNYGIAAYNNRKSEVSFNTTELTSADGEVKIKEGDNTLNNSNGIDHFYSKTNLPAYAYAYLLTSILSDDYVDIDGDGPTENDLGSYTKFHYSLVNPDFKWRTPVNPDSAFFNEGLLSSNVDQKGNYSEGEKEIWLINSIETRNYSARFYFSGRTDARGIGLNDINYKLDSIILYTKSELIDSEKEHRIAIPIQKSIFGYSNNLCVGAENNRTENNRTGKLTLESVYNIYKNSLLGRNHPYEFSYSNNPPYAKQASDRWGRLKPSKSSMNNERFPYAEQNKALADVQNSAWLMTSIDLPSKGRIEVEYESDDYAFVQNKRAMEMLEIAGFSAIKGNNQLLPSLNDELNADSYMYFKLNKPIAATTEEAEWQSAIRKDLRELYYNAIVNINVLETQECIEGFITMDRTIELGLAKSNSEGDYTYGYIKINSVPVDNHSFFRTHPISRDAWQYMRLNNLQAMYEGNTNFAIDETAIIESGEIPLLEIGQNIVGEIASVGQTYLQMFTGGFSQFAYAGQFASTIVSEKSFIRLNIPEGQNKIGGGSRVKSITLHDGWAKSTVPNNPQSNVYKTEYQYTLDDGINSSGVASYEPMIGKQENPFFQPNRYNSLRTFGPDDHVFTLEPFGETLYPGASIGYSHVKITQSGTETGYTLNNFYTAKDFPTIAKRTERDFKNFKFIFPIWVNISIDLVAVSQGFYIETNDMHGKPKAETIFDEANNIVKKSEYFYLTDQFGKLSNEVLTATKEGIDKRTVGLDWDMIVDARHSSNTQHIPSVEVNLDNFVIPMVPPIPVAVPVPLPSYALDWVSFNSLAVTKSVQRCGLLDRILITDKGSVIATQNFVYDAFTGNVVVNCTNNEFKDSIWTTNLPAYWTYPRMGHASWNQGLNREINLITGDEVLIKGGNTNQVAWFLGDNTFKSSGGEIIPGNNNFKIIRSGNTNQLSSYSGSVVTKAKPISSEGKLIFDQVLNASANTFQDSWQIYKLSEHEYPKTECHCGAYDDKVIVNQIKYINQLFPTDDKDKPVKNLDHKKGSEVIEIFDEKTKCKIILYTHKPVQAVTGIHPLFDTLNCVSTGYFLADVIYTDEKHDKVKGYSSCFSLGFCSLENIPPEKQCYVGTDQEINPFSTGIFRSFKPDKQFHYETNRLFDGHSRSSGIYNAFSSYWDLGIIGSSKSKTNWIAPIKTEIIDPLGKVLQTMDTLGNYTSAIYGYGHNLVTATAKNAKINEIAFESFEDFHYANHTERNGDCPDTTHWSFRELVKSEPDPKAEIDVCNSHSGINSLRMVKDSFDLVIPILPRSSQPGNRDPSAFIPNQNDIITSFQPSPNEYIISAWVKLTKGSNIYNLKRDSTLRVKVIGDNLITTHYLLSTSPVIDGWQLVEARFTIPKEIKEFRIIAKKKSNQEMWIDDIRIHPFHATMQTYTYYPQSLKLHAVLDDTNFASFYEYDEEGNLARTKKETERGIMTLKEIKSAQAQN